MEPWECVRSVRESEERRVPRQEALRNIKKEWAREKEYTGKQK